MSVGGGAFLDVEPGLLTDRLSVLGGALADDDALAALTMPAEAAAHERRSDTLEIAPQPAVCCKTRDRAGAKVFVNVCTSGEIPPPELLTEDELRRLLQDAERAPQFRVPMSLSEAHKELDKSGGPCTAYDVVIHPQFFTQVDSSLLFKTFFITVVITAIEEKFDVELDKNQWVTMRNKLYMGKMPRHFIRRRDLPMVQECSRADAAAARRDSASRPLITELTTRRTGAPPADTAPPPPPDTVPHQVERRADGRLVVTLRLPASVTSQCQLTVELADDRLVVAAEAARLLADVSLPQRVAPDSAHAAFSLASRRLVVSVQKVA